MRLSRYFLPMLRETPKEAEIVSHRLMLRAGMIRQQAAEEQNRAGAIEMLMPTIQPAELWRESGRYEDYGDEMLRIEDRHERDMLYGPTNEEMITEIFRAYVKSYKQLPLNLYHIQWKFRDELRPRFGVYRAREFLMKDAYSFDLDAAASRHSYNKMFVAYLRTFARLGLKSIPMVAESGPIGGNLSHEFIILASTGESEVFCHRDYLDFPVPDEKVDFENAASLQKIVDQWTSLYAATSEKHDAAAFGKIPQAKRLSARGIEVGHIFYFGTKYVALLNLKQGDGATDGACEKLYGELSARGIDVLYDDSDERAGAKFAAADLIGLPWQLLVGPKGLAEGKVELKRRAGGAREMLSPADALTRLAG